MEKLPIPSNVVTACKKHQAKSIIERMQIENMLLKHLVETLDPEHNYIFNQEKLELHKVHKDYEKVQSSTNKDSSEQADESTGDDRGDTEAPPFRGTVNFGIK